MIKNTQQENLTKGKIDELRRLQQSIKEDESLSELEKLYSVNSFEGMIGTLQEELEEYNAVKNGNLHILKANSLEDLPKLIIQSRIAQQMSQTDLANKLGVKPQQIQRYESFGYQNISFHRLIEIAHILGVCVRFENTLIIGSGPRFEIPNNITEEDIIKAEQIIKERRSLVF